MSPALLSENNVATDADFAMIKAIHLARQVAREASRAGPKNNMDYLVEGLHIGVLWVLWGEQAVHDFSPWYKHARRVIIASDKRTDAPTGRLENLIPPHLLNQNEPVTRASFVRSAVTK
ncbi:MAG: hypothetical protein Q8Q09_22885 [Deltaproteobacteria bacterium]|nr:hypothetical protein [Deltaproteobacteria bacterium]